MANPGDFAYSVKQQADIVRIVGDYVKLKKAGAQNYSGLCPFYSEKQPSFSVHATRQFYHCFRFGYARHSGFPRPARLRGEFAADILRESGLCSWKQEESRQPSAVSSQEQQGKSAAAMYSQFRNRVMFPITNESGRVIAFTGRTLSTDEKSGPKYLNSPETAIYSKSRVLFNLDLAKEAIRKLDYAILVEGQMDCISVFAAGFHNVIASSGMAFTELHAKLLARFSKNVVVNFDPDTAGAKATERTLGLLVEEEF